MTVIDLAAFERPRVLHVPPYSSSAGDEAVDLAASAGLILDPWQAFVLRQSLGERADGRWSAFEVGLIVARQQGKGSVLEARELFGLVLAGERQVVHTAHELKTSMKHFKRLIRLLDGSDDLRKRVKKVINSNGKEGLEMVNGAVLECLARTKGAGRGYTGDLVVFDEAYALTNEQLEASAPTMLAVDNAQIWYTSSPPLDAESGKVLMNLRKRGERGDAPRLAWFDYGLAGTLDRLEKVDLDDRDNWDAALPAYRSGRVREEGVLVLRDLLGDVGFAREVLGMWPPELSEGGFRIIPEPLWQEACAPGSQIVGRPAFAVHVTPDRAYAAIVAAGDTGTNGGKLIELTSRMQLVDGTIKVVYDYFAGTAQVIPRLKEMEKHNPSVIVIDDKALADEAEKQGLVIHRSNVTDVVTGCQLFYDGVAGADPAGRNVHHLGQKDLTDAVSRAEKRKVGNSWAWEFPDSPLGAASLALFGHCTPRVHRPAAAPFFGAWR
jgi:hypothetical protein